MVAVLFVAGLLVFGLGIKLGEREEMSEKLLTGLLVVGMMCILVATMMLSHR